MLKFLQSSWILILMWCSFIFLYAAATFILEVDIEAIAPFIPYSVGIVAGIITGVWVTLIFKKE